MRTTLCKHLQHPNVVSAAKGKWERDEGEKDANICYRAIYVQTSLFP
jgi:hypothetical protein